MGLLHARWTAAGEQRHGLVFPSPKGKPEAGSVVVPIRRGKQAAAKVPVVAIVVGCAIRH